jgi:hypothetical protein
MKIVYSEKTGHVKCDERVVGMIEQNGAVVEYRHFSFNPAIRAQAPTLAELSPKIREIIAWIMNNGRS